MRSELLLYDIGVHIPFPGNTLSPGYAKENETKPKITLKIEEDDSGLQPEQVAEKLLDGMHVLRCYILMLPTVSFPGVQKGHFHIASDLISDLMRSGTRGATPHNNVLLDIVYGIIGWVRTIAQSILLLSSGLKTSTDWACCLASRSGQGHRKPPQGARRISFGPKVLRRASANLRVRCFPHKYLSDALFIFPSQSLQHVACTTRN